MLPRFWRKIKYRYNLVGTKCKNCGEIFYPPRNICPTCRRKGEMVEVELGNKGIILSYSIIHETPESNQLMRPYAVGIIELESGARVTGQIVGDFNRLRIGARVKAVFRKYGEDGEDGIIYYGTKFEVVD